MPTGIGNRCSQLEGETKLNQSCLALFLALLLPLLFRHSRSFQGPPASSAIRASAMSAFSSQALTLWTSLPWGEIVPESGKDEGSAKNSSFLELLPVVRQQIIDGFTPKATDVFRREFDFFDKVTSISGVLFPKEE